MKRANDIGRHIAKLRRLQGWTQDMMASRMQCLGERGYEITRQILGNIECGRTNIYHWQIEVIRNVLGCSFDEIFLGTKMNSQQTGTLFKKPRKRSRQTSKK